MKILISLFIIIYLSGQCLGAPLVISKILCGQTHIIPGDVGLSWVLSSQSETLHLVGNRDTLLLLELNGLTNLVNAKVEGLIGTQTIGSVVLNDPTQLPPTESNGTKFSTTSYSTFIPASWMKVGLQIRAIANTYDPSAYKTLFIGQDASLDLNILPFYLFGANDTNSQKFSELSTIPPAKGSEFYQKLPVSRLNVKNFGAKRVDWPYLIFRPNGTNPAVKISNIDQADKFVTMGYILDILNFIRSANGLNNLNNQFYSPICWLNSKGESSHSGGGLGTLHRSTGDTTFTGVFIHEVGHAFGLPHSVEAYANGKYPYPKGSLSGSAWGYDKNHNQILSITIPTTAYHYNGCNTSSSVVLNGLGQCLKQSVMQSGDGDQSSGYYFSMYADFEVGVIQRYFEGTTTIKDGIHEYKGGSAIVDNTFPSGYKRWDTIDKKYVNFPTLTTDGGVFGLNQSLPIIKNVPVYTIIATVSLANTSGVTQLYPPLYYTGNLLQYIDPTNAKDLAYIKPNTGPIPWYCHGSGCDFTLQATFSDKSKSTILLQSGLREWFKLNDPISSNYFQPLNSLSLRSFSVNLPSQKTLVRVQIFYTPSGYNGFNSSESQNLLDYSCSGNKENLQCEQYTPGDSVEWFKPEESSDSEEISNSIKLNINVYLLLFSFILFSITL